MRWSRDTVTIPDLNEVVAGCGVVMGISGWVSREPDIHNKNALTHLLDWVQRPQEKVDEKRVVSLLHDTAALSRVQAAVLQNCRLTERKECVVLPLCSCGRWAS